MNRSGTLFAKFQSADFAQEAIQALNGHAFDEEQGHQPMKADYAKRELEPQRNRGMPSHQVDTRERHSSSLNHAPPSGSGSGRHHHAPPGLPYGGHHEAAAPLSSDITTVTIIGAERKGVSRDELKDWFQRLPGYITLQMNEKIDAIFVKFSSHRDAERALREANVANLGAEWARRNLDEGEREVAYQIVPTTGGHHPPALHTAKRSRGGGGDRESHHREGSSSTLDTLAVLGVQKRGLNSEDLQDWFIRRTGYEKLKVNDNIDAIFVKFASRDDADKALQDANELEFGAEWARRNLE